MPKIAPRLEITEHPLYQDTMAAQHLAYQLMRGVPADRKAEAARLNLSCVHATTYAQYALDPDVPDKPESYEGLRNAAAKALRQLEALVPVAPDSRDVETLQAKLTGIEKQAAESRG